MSKKFFHNHNKFNIYFLFMMFYIYHLNIDVFYIVFLKLFFVVDLFYFFHFFNNFIFALIFELTFEYLNLILHFLGVFKVLTEKGLILLFLILYIMFYNFIFSIFNYIY